MKHMSHHHYECGVEKSTIELVYIVILSALSLDNSCKKHNKVTYHVAGFMSARVVSGTSSPESGTYGIIIGGKVTDKRVIGHTQLCGNLHKILYIHAI